MINTGCFDLRSVLRYQRGNQNRQYNGQKIKYKKIWSDLIYCVQRHFSNIMVTSFCCGRSRRKPPTMDKQLYHLRLRVECTLFCNLESRTRTHAVLMLGVYELLSNITNWDPRAFSTKGQTTISKTCTMVSEIFFFYFKLLSFQIFLLWSYLIRLIPATCRVQYI